MSDEKKPTGELNDKELEKVSGGADGSVRPVETIQILPNLGEGATGLKIGPVGPGPGGGN